MSIHGENPIKWTRTSPAIKSMVETAKLWNVKSINLETERKEKLGERGVGISLLEPLGDYRAGMGNLRPRGPNATTGLSTSPLGVTHCSLALPSLSSSALIWLECAPWTAMIHLTCMVAGCRAVGMFM